MPRIHINTIHPKHPLYFWDYAASGSFHSVDLQEFPDVVGGDVVVLDESIGKLPHGLEIHTWKKRGKKGVRMVVNDGANTKEKG